MVYYWPDISLTSAYYFYEEIAAHKLLYLHSLRIQNTNYNLKTQKNWMVQIKSNDKYYSK